MFGGRTGAETAGGRVGEQPTTASETARISRRGRGVMRVILAQAPFRGRRTTGGWRANAIFIAQAGAPFSVNLSVDRANIGAGPAAARGVSPGPTEQQHQLIAAPPSRQQLEPGGHCSIELPGKRRRAFRGEYEDLACRWSFVPFDDEQHGVTVAITTRWVEQAGRVRCPSCRGRPREFVRELRNRTRRENAVAESYRRGWELLDDRNRLGKRLEDRREKVIPGRGSLIQSSLELCFGECDHHAIAPRGFSNVRDDGSAE